MSTIEHDYTTLEKVICNQSLSAAIPNLVRDYDNKRIFILSSNSLNTKSDVIQNWVANFGDAVVAVFDRIRAHTPRQDVLEAVTEARLVKADVIVAIGGGSIIDAAKAVQLALNLEIQNKNDFLQYAQLADGTRGPKTSDLLKGMIQTQNAVRVIAVPTALSGAEFSNTAGVLDLESGNKEGYRSPTLYPRAIVYDPEITLHTPEWLWLSTAIRSVDHAVEGYCAQEVYPFLQGQFLHALTLFGQSLRKVKLNPQDLAARAINQQAVWLACCGLGKVSHGASHGIGYILGSLCKVPHGYTSCVMLPAVLTWNAEVNGAQQHAIASALGESKTTSASATIKQLISDLGLPLCLQDVGIARNQLPEIAARAAKHRVVQSNPRTIRRAEEVMEILELAWN
jgi:maleylacetate reductase